MDKPTVESGDSQAALKLIGSHYKLFTDETPPANICLMIEGLDKILDKVY